VRRETWCSYTSGCLVQHQLHVNVQSIATVCGSTNRLIGTDRPNFSSLTSSSSLARLAVNFGARCWCQIWCHMQPRGAAGGVEPTCKRKQCKHATSSQQAMFNSTEVDCQTTRLGVGYTASTSYYDSVRYTMATMPGGRAVTAARQQSCQTKRVYVGSTLNQVHARNHIPRTTDSTSPRRVSSLLSETTKTQ
jgi:hypothetical protein